MISNDELLKSISARVLVALESNRRGNNADVNKVLETLKRILPVPEQRNIDAAFAELDG